MSGVNLNRGVRKELHVWVRFRCLICDRLLLCALRQFYVFKGVSAWFSVATRPKRIRLPIVVADTDWRFPEEGSRKLDGNVASYYRNGYSPGIHNDSRWQEDRQRTKYARQGL